MSGKLAGADRPRGKKTAILIHAMVIGDPELTQRLLGVMKDDNLSAA